MCRQVFLYIASLCCCFTVSLAQTQVHIKAGTIALLTANAMHADSYSWFKNNLPVSGANGKSLSTGEAGLYTVIAYNSLGCSSPLSDTVKLIVVSDDMLPDVAIHKTVEERDVVFPEAFEYTLLVVNNSTTMANNLVVTDKLSSKLKFLKTIGEANGQVVYDDHSATLTWKIDSLAPEASIAIKISVSATEPGWVSNTAAIAALKNEVNIKDNVSTSVKEILPLKIPNVFTPNGDGMNDLFVIAKLGDFAENELSIMDRWNNMVYKKQNYKNDWDGSTLTAGTYFYVLKIRMANGDWASYKGYVTLMR